MKQTMHIWKIAAFTFFTLLLCSCSANEAYKKADIHLLKTEPGIELPREEKQATVMIYMIGSDLESSSGTASKDIEEMEKSGLDFEKTNVILYTGGCIHWKNGISGTQDTVFQLTNQGRTAVAKTAEPQNMGSSEVLSEFLNFSYKYFPAQQFALIFWDHGNGPVFGFGQDETHENDGLTLSEMEAAFQQSPFTDSNPLEWVGFDACLMADIEVAQMLDDHAYYLVASQETMPSSGWDYSFLEEYNLNPGTEPIADRLISSYTYIEPPYDMAAYKYRKTPALTLSCMRLDQVKDTVMAMDGLFGKMKSSLELGQYYPLARCRDSTKRFGLGAVLNRPASLDLVDLEDMARQLTELFPAESNTLIEQISHLVLFRGGNTENACGVSVYYPYDSKENFKQGGQTLFDMLSDSANYNEYMKQFTEIWENETKLDNGLVDGYAANGNWLAISLPSDRLQDISSISYSILSQTADGTYAPLVSGCQAHADDGGSVEINLNQDLFYISSPIPGPTPFWSVNHLEDQETRTAYQLYGALLSDDSDSPLIQRAFVSFLERNSRPENSFQEGSIWEKQIDIESILADKEENLHGGKNDMDLLEWQYIAQEDPIPQAGEENIDETELLNTPKRVPVQEHIRLCAKEAAATSLNMACQVTVRDRFGNEYVLLYEYPASGLVNENLKGGDGDVLSDSMRLLYSGDCGGLMAVNAERREILIAMEYGKGADIPWAVLNQKGYPVIFGYEDAIWFTEEGYGKILFFEPGEEWEADDIYSIAIHEQEGDAYAALYDAEGNFIEKQLLDSADGEMSWYIDAKEIYPDNQVNIYNGLRPEITWTEEADGYRVFDSSGAEAGFISVDDLTNTRLSAVGSAVQLWGESEQGYDGCKRIYWVDDAGE